MFPKPAEGWFMYRHNPPGVPVQVAGTGVCRHCSGSTYTQAWEGLETSSCRNSSRKRLPETKPGQVLPAGRSRFTGKVEYLSSGRRPVPARKVYKVVVLAGVVRFSSFLLPGERSVQNRNGLQVFKLSGRTAVLMPLWWYYRLVGRWKGSCSSVCCHSPRTN